nr:SGNH hydrolase-type esterase domain-containing protein [Tanacetum cinerariifolium]
MVRNGDDKLPLSVYKVLSNDDLLIEILLRLPVISLVLFKSVSKQWLSLITSPNFIKSRNLIPNIDPTCGILILRVNDERQRLEYDFKSFDIRIPSKRSTVFTLGSEAPLGCVEIMQSCNGLLLCGVHPDKYYVYNPTTKLFKTLPIKSPISSVKIAFDPTKSPHYKVIQADFVHDDEHGFGYYVQIQTYSSETGKLSVCGDRFALLCFTQFKDGIYWNDAIHWVNSGYDMSSHCKLEIVNDHPVLTKIQFPVTFAGRLHFPSNLLLLCMDKADSRHMTTFEMRNGYSEWLVKYISNLDDIMIPAPSISMWKINHRIWSIILGERDEDSFMIIDVLILTVSASLHLLLGFDFACFRLNVKVHAMEKSVWLLWSCSISPDLGILRGRSWDSRLVKLIHVERNIVVGKPQVPCYFIFGDSLVDSGNNNGLVTFARTNYPPYGIDFPEGATGRFTNGRTFADIIGQLLGFEKFIPSHTAATDEQISIGVNYASGTSGIREETGIHLGDRINMDTQLLNHNSTISRLLRLQENTTFLEKCIYLVNTGNNDYINNYFLSDKYNTSRIYTTNEYASVLIQQLSQQLQTLYSLGARKIVVNGVIRLGCIPFAVDTFDTDGKPCVEPINDAVKLYNDRLRPLIDELNTNYSDARFTFINMTRISSLRGANMSLSTTPCCQLNEEIVTTSIATRSYTALSPLDASPYDISDLVRLHDVNHYADI